MISPILSIYKRFVPKKKLFYQYDSLLRILWVHFVSFIPPLSRWLAPSAPNAVGAPFCIDSATTMTSVWDMGPKVGFDGQNYLVVWARQQQLDAALFNHEIRAARVTPTCQILDPKGVVIAPGPKKYNSFSLAFNGKAFFIAWEVELPTGSDPGSIIEGRLLSFSPSGDLVLGPLITIDDSATPSPDGYPRVKHGGPHVAYTGSEFLVIYKTDDNSASQQIWQWQNAKLGLYARRVSYQGTLQGGKTLLLAYDNAVGPILRPPRLEFAQPGTGLILFTAYSTYNDSYNVYMMGIALSGGMPQVSSPALVDRVTGAPPVKRFENPRLAAGPSCYLLLWESNVMKPPNCNSPDLYGTVFHLQPGGVIPTPVPLAQGDDESDPAVAYDGKNFTLIYRHLIGCHAYPGTGRVNTQGIIGKQEVFMTQNLVQEFDLSFGTSNGLAVFWNENLQVTTPNSNSLDVWAQLIDKSP